MFTGIIEATATVVKRTDTGITLARPQIFSGLSIGQSIAVNGACLTVTRLQEKEIGFDVVPETFRRTNLGTAELVNLERAMPATGRFEGHIVLGHVDGTTRLISRTAEGEGERFAFALPAELQRYFVAKGSACINGISLTIAALTAKTFEIAVIPHTLAMTNLGTLSAGDEVNFEADYFAKLVLKATDPLCA
jgi:riboflavin synthase